MVHACAPVRLLGSGFGGTYPAAEEIQSLGLIESLENNLRTLCPPYGPPAGTLKQTIDAHWDIAVLATEGVVDVLIDGLSFDERGATEEIAEGYWIVVVEEASGTSALEENDDVFEEAITKLWTEEETELVEEMELMLELAPVPL
ncbi:uncharacterized protein Bfra_008447 [Botrytis fragariae]|uniref:Uncharacterized protein n=1 Tax=Botrytis fragariae TaxID=1964551 RepID=A0A8H6ATF7_9HELO|nr:uncharacterized protein Bfra_008447 [Botrytis fragariae]KAF5873169.1 hypothetical protein Bfra_008447 [Botrytis fragariae]